MTVAVPAIYYSSNALAQQSSDTTQLETITVTADRRQENNQDVPISIFAITASDAKSLGAVSTESLAQLVPGLVYDREGPGSIPFLRGVGTAAGQIGDEPSVALYVDDVYTPSGVSGLFDYNNIASVEVEKGPQGTLFGRNATGGVIQVFTKDPTRDPAVDANVGYANFNTYSGSVYATTGLSDSVAVNVAATGSEQLSGWGHNVITGAKTFDGWSYGVRTKLQWTPTGGTSVLASFSFDDIRTEQGDAGRNVANTYGFGGYSPGNISFWDTTGNVNNYQIDRTYQGSLKIKQHLDWASIVSVSAFTHANATAFEDADVSPANFFGATPFVQTGDTFTQEFQLLSRDDSKLKWILGVFYLNDRSTYLGDYYGSVFTIFGGNGSATSYGRQGTNSIAGFGQATGEILPDTNLTAGLRYTVDSKDFFGSSSWNSSPPAIGGPYTDSKSWDSPTGRVSLDHKFTSDIMAYIAYNKGFKSGVFNTAGTAPSPFPYPAAPFPTAYAAASPEKLNAYTIGAKTEWLQHTLRVNVEGFYYDYTNIQVTELIPGGAVTLNGGAATIKGVDLDASYVPVDNLVLTASTEVMDGKYDSFPNGPQVFPEPPNAPIPIPAGCGPISYPSGPPPAAEASCNLSGNKTVRTPPFSLTLAARYHLTTNVGPFDMDVAWAHGGDYYFDPDNSHTTKQPVTNVVNGSLTWTAQKQFDVRLWVKNLTDMKYYSYATGDTTAGAKYSPAAPRTFGIEFGLHY